MNIFIKYIILLNAIISLSGTLCWGAASGAKGASNKFSCDDEVTAQFLKEQGAGSADSSVDDIVDSSETGAKTGDDQYHENTSGGQYSDSSDARDQTGDRHSLNSSTTLKRKSNKNINTANRILLRTVMYGDTDEITRMLEKGTDINIADEYFLDLIGCTVLGYAANKGHQVMVDVLLANGADINKADRDGWTPLMCAARWNQDGVLAILLENKANVNATSNNGETALMFIADAGYLGNFYQKAATQLIKAKADVNVIDKEGRSALFMAALGSYDTKSKVLAKQLIQANADVNVAFAKAIDCGDQDAAKFLRGHGAKISDPTQNQIEKLSELGIPQKQGKCNIS